MPSRARAALTARLSDVERIIEIHEELTGKRRGKRTGVEVLNRSAIVHLTAAWEGYVENLAAESVAHLVMHLADPNGLPKNLRKSIATELKADPNHVALWVLAGDGWRAHLETRLDEYAVREAGRFNSPASGKVLTLFRDMVGLPDLPSYWLWQGMRSTSAQDRLDRLVTLRGNIAHGTGTSTGVRKGAVRMHLGHVQRLADRSDEALHAYLRGLTGVEPY